MELRLATIKGFKSKHDDCIDTITMLKEMYTWRPSDTTMNVDSEGNSTDDIWEEETEPDYGDSSYFV